MLNTWYVTQGIAKKMRQLHNLLCTCRNCRPKPILNFTCLTSFNLIFLTSPPFAAYAATPSGGRRGDVKHVVCNTRDRPKNATTTQPAV